MLECVAECDKASDKDEFAKKVAQFDVLLEGSEGSSQEFMSKIRALSCCRIPLWLIEHASKVGNSMVNTDNLMF